MIFDPDLAAAARRHERAKRKAQKSPADAENAGCNSASTGTNINISTPSSNTPAAGKVAAAEETLNAEGKPAPAADSAAEGGELGELGGVSEAKDTRPGEKEAGSSSNSVGDDGSTGGSVGAPGTRSRTGSGSSNGVDFEGATARVRAGGGASRQRPMKPRVLLKIVVLGCSNVGKTSLMKRYAAGDFTDKRRPTVGADFMTKEVVEGDQPMLLQIWDTAGQERFHGGSLGSGFFRGANAALLVYDVACAVSFEQVAMWREELLVRLDVNPHDFPIVVIGNKVDLASAVPMDGVQGVDKTRVTKWCEMQGMGHIETSAKDGTGVEVAMQAVAVLALEQKRQRERDLALNPNYGGGTTLDLADQRARQQRTGGCCW
eukprot:g11049.t1